MTAIRIDGLSSQFESIENLEGLLHAPERLLGGVSFHLENFLGNALRPGRTEYPDMIISVWELDSWSGEYKEAQDQIGARLHDLGLEIPRAIYSSCEKAFEYSKKHNITMIRNAGEFRSWTNERLSVQ